MDGFTKEDAQFWEFSLPNVLLCFIRVVMELLLWLDGELQFHWLCSELSIKLQFVYYADFYFAGFLLMVWPASLCLQNTQ